MRYRTLGRTGWQVGDVGYGMWGIGGWTSSDDDESLRSLHRAVELGCNFFDTAWAHGQGHSERLLGRLVRALPDKRLYVASKIPPKNSKWPARPEYPDVTLAGLNIPIRIGGVTVLPGDIVLGTPTGVIFIPPHLVQKVVETSEDIRVRNEFGKIRLDESKYTSGEINVPVWRDDIEADFQAWKKANKK